MGLVGDGPSVSTIRVLISLSVFWTTEGGIKMLVMIIPSITRNFRVIYCL